MKTAGRAVIALAALTSLAGCDSLKSAFTGEPNRGRFDSAWHDMEPQRLVHVKGVDYDVNLRWFTGAERALMVHRIDKQPMFEIDSEREKAMLAATQAYASDVCFGESLAINAFAYERPGVWVVQGACPGAAPQAPQFAAGHAEAGAEKKEGGLLSFLFGSR